MRGGPGADTLVYTTPDCGQIDVIFIGWEPGVDKITGTLNTWETDEYGVCTYAARCRSARCVPTS